MEMGLGLESKTGALRKLGEPYPAEKMEELISELHQDALEQGAIDLLKTQIRSYIQLVTGIDPMADGAPGGQQGGVQSAGGPGVNSAGDVQPPAPNFADDPAIQDVMQQINTLAAGTKQIQTRNPMKDPSDND